MGLVLALISATKINGEIAHAFEPNTENYLDRCKPVCKYRERDNISNYKVNQLSEKI
jgi:hypothetical protein